MNAVTIRTDNSAEGIAKIGQLWRDVMSGKTSLVLGADMIPISRYSNYASDETGEYDLSILAVDCKFLRKLDEESTTGKYKKYDVSSDDNDIPSNTKRAWGQVWQDTNNGFIQRSYTEDYEYTIPPEYSPDHKLHCLLYIAVKQHI